VAILASVERRLVPAVITGLLDPRFLVEIEADAIAPVG
jgi:hypothetical protein